MKKQIDFYFDVVSPYSYVASTLIEDVAQRCNADLLWNPILLGGIFKAVGTSNAPGLTPAKKPYMLKDLQRLSRHYGIPLQMPPDFPVRTVLVMRSRCQDCRLSRFHRQLTHFSMHTGRITWTLLTGKWSRH